MNILGNSIKEIRKSKKMTQNELSQLTGFKQNTISNHENGKRQLDETDIRIYAAALEVEPQQLFSLSKVTTPTASPDLLTQQINDKLVQLTPDNKKIVLRTSEELLKEQKNEEETKINEVSEVISLYQVEVVSETAAASGFNYGFGYDDTDRETIEVDEQPPRHDIATKVSGDSMQPDYQDGDILYLVDKGLTTYNGDLAVIAYGDRSYFKKIYTENGRLRLVSLNDKYEDIILDFPPAEDTHIKIYAVVGVYRGE
ncbi:helix-turn-helix domain-containing protein [Streptococcus pseudopneumoniae]|uniref:LexA family transcriptional regulator n=1 Tax=Streptococcus pseudopneumoniae TaxID=257758 RepID=UPI0014199633|nr:S24 family peptidase [Streptococcus pseudopneumoniae]NIB78897.1 helix-turn-helix domain-containing protein [Streptococcus pseudopneumoniae]NIB90854.1 helix-turn-helix domain-containing protein [Streptococcus pseudopneumoniae]